MSLAGNRKTAEPFIDEFGQAVLDGLSGLPRRIPCRYLYDARGSELFEEITQLEEYYPTRTEISLLAENGPEIAEMAGEGCAVVEFGSGSSRKTHILLEHMDRACAYVPIDIDDTALEDAAQRLRAEFPRLPLHPVHANFDQEIRLPKAIEGKPKLGFFPGSTIGNFELDAATRFLGRAGDLLGPGSALLIGADLQKDRETLIAAYDDAEGVTAEFTLNLVKRINRELDGTLDVGKFEHQAIYNEDAGCVEIYLVSRRDQEFEILGEPFALERGERIHVENSHKYTIPQFRDLARRAEWVPEKVWTDGNELFSIHYLVRN